MGGGKVAHAATRPPNHRIWQIDAGLTRAQHSSRRPSRIPIFVYDLSGTPSSLFDDPTMLPRCDCALTILSEVEYLQQAGDPHVQFCDSLRLGGCAAR